MDLSHTSAPPLPSYATPCLDPPPFRPPGASPHPTSVRTPVSPSPTRFLAREEFRGGNIAPDFNEFSLTISARPRILPWPTGCLPRLPRTPDFPICGFLPPGGLARLYCLSRSPLLPSSPSRHRGTVVSWDTNEDEVSAAGNGNKSSFDPTMPPWYDLGFTHLFSPKKLLLDLN